MTKQRIFTITQKWRFRYLQKYSLTFDYISDFVVSFEQKPSQLIRPHAGVVRFWSRRKPEHTLRSTEAHPASMIGKSGSSINSHHTNLSRKRQQVAILVKRGSSRQVFPEQAVPADFVFYDVLLSTDYFTHFQQHSHQPDLPHFTKHALPRRAWIGNDFNLELSR